MVIVTLTTIPSRLGNTSYGESGMISTINSLLNQTYYEYETELNENKRNITILKPEFAIDIETRDDKMKAYKMFIYRHEGQMTLLIPDLVEASMHGKQIVDAIRDGYNSVSKEVYKLLVSKFVPRNGPTRYFFNKEVNISTYGYAISCHKAQGQEWDNVYIDAGWLMPVWDSAKWFYTAITRAKCKVEVTNNKYLRIN